MISWKKPDNTGKVHGTAVYHYLVETEDGRDIRHGFIGFVRQDDLCTVSVGMGPTFERKIVLVKAPFDDAVLLETGLNLVLQTLVCDAVWV